MHIVHLSGSWIQFDYYFSSQRKTFALVLEHPNLKSFAELISDISWGYQVLRNGAPDRVLLEGAPDWFSEMEHPIGFSEMEHLIVFSGREHFDCVFRKGAPEWFH